MYNFNNKLKTEQEKKSSRIRKGEEHVPRPLPSISRKRQIDDNSRSATQDSPLTKDETFKGMCQTLKNYKIKSNFLYNN